jgi:rhamnulose-1-phosphate aldolase/alcohol dehydrogenase
MDSTHTPSPRPSPSLGTGIASRWSETEARAAVARWGARWGEDLALRTYSARLIGADESLVLHGGGNTSVKSVGHDLLGEEIALIFVKGSGWNLGTIEPPGHPAIDLHYLRRLRALPNLSDEEMVNAIRTHLLDAAAPTPSIETLLHAWLPHKFVDHSHADAILALTNSRSGQALVRDVLGPGIEIVPYVKPGFTLAQEALSVFERRPEVAGLVLMHHGLFTFGETAEESYRRHIELVDRAARFLEQRAGASIPVAIDRDGAAARATRLAPLLRGALAQRGAEGAIRRCVLSWRRSTEVLELVSAPGVREWVMTGTLTPDHVIRTKAHPLLVELPDDPTDDGWREAIRAPLARFRSDYQRYFERNAGAQGGVERYVRLDDTPAVIVVPGVGLFGVGATPEDAAIAADIAEHTLGAKRLVDALGGWQSLTASQLFEIEYWSLEQAKLKSSAEPPLARRVALVTGGAGAIGFGIARALLAAGACVVLADIDEGALGTVRSRLGAENRTAAVRADVTDAESLAQAFGYAARVFGGVDIVVANAGIARMATLETMDAAEFRKVVEVNLTGVFLTLQQAARHLARQGTGGSVVVISSKNVFAPGEEFGAYSASKAGAHQLGRVAAMEMAKFGVRVNFVSPDAVFAEGEVPSGLWQEIGPARARMRGIEPGALPDHYRDRNLLHAAVTGIHVGRAVVFFASEQTPTTGAVLSIDGGIPAAFAR